ncbi:hypothetical protein BV898_17212 [Hypsibius exemplaris]|uniref:Uncharacterized protein n=1 Tax=Hypsibius exemplaris TaxID=2072580 RepID=A0A9X6NGF1_HYPEX|nr:hypothetical protein BV898_17212 [Hypsibius exemplaris]
MTPSMKTIGIDFGTTNIYLAVWADRAVQLVRNATTGRASTLSFIVFNDDDDDDYDDEVAFDQDARSLSTLSCRESGFIMDVKAFLGLEMHTARAALTAGAYAMHLATDSPADSPGDGDGGVRFRLQHGKCVSVGSAARLLLHQAYSLAASHCSDRAADSPLSCVITVSAEWGDERRSALLRACSLAGFVAPLLVDEAAATLMGCFLRTLNSTNTADNIVVVDVGSSGTSVTVFRRSRHNGLTEVTRFPRLEVCGNTVTQRITQHCRERFETEHRIRILEHSQPLHRLRLECEDAKIRLSTVKTVNVIVRSCVDGIDLKVIVDRTLLDDVSRDDVATLIQAIETAEKALQVDHVGEMNNFEIFLVGGASRLKALRKGVEARFAAQLNASPLLFCEEATLYGAAGLGGIIDRLPEARDLDVSRHGRALCELLRPISAGSTTDGAPDWDQLQQYVRKWLQSEAHIYPPEETIRSDAINELTKPPLGEGDRLGQPSLFNFPLKNSDCSNGLNNPSNLRNDTAIQLAIREITPFKPSQITQATGEIFGPEDNLSTPTTANTDGIHNGVIARPKVPFDGNNIVSLPASKRRAVQSHHDKINFFPSSGYGAREGTDSAALIRSEGYALELESAQDETAHAGANSGHHIAMAPSLMSSTKINPLTENNSPGLTPNSACLGDPFRIVTISPQVEDVVHLEVRHYLQATVSTVTSSVSYEPPNLMVQSGLPITDPRSQAGTSWWSSSAFEQRSVLSIIDEIQQSKDIAKTDEALSDPTASQAQRMFTQPQQQQPYDETPARPIERQASLMPSPAWPAASYNPGGGRSDRNPGDQEILINDRNVRPRTRHYGSCFEWFIDRFKAK